MSFGGGDAVMMTLLGGGAREKEVGR